VIRINLLPAELRRGNRLPPKVLAVSFGAALATSAAVAWFGLVYFGDLGAAESKQAEVDATLNERQVRVGYFEQLEENKRDYASRVQTIQDIGKSRRVWSKFLDELIDVVNNNGDTERHLAWFESIVAKTETKGATVNMPVQVQDDDLSRLANFHDDLEAGPFGRELTFKSDPNYTKAIDKVRIPPTSLQFRLEMQLQAPTTPTNPAAGAKAPAQK
jgi:Tfp pilus assembly protein PilN